MLPFQANQLSDPVSFGIGLILHNHDDGRHDCNSQRDSYVYIAGLEMFLAAAAVADGHDEDQDAS